MKSTFGVTELKFEAFEFTFNDSEATFEGFEYKKQQAAI